MVEVIAWMVVVAISVEVAASSGTAEITGVGEESGNGVDVDRVNVGVADETVVQPTPAIITTNKAKNKTSVFGLKFMLTCFSIYDDNCSTQFISFILRLFASHNWLTINNIN